MTIFASITAIAQLILQIIQGAKALAAFIEKNKNEKWFSDAAVTFSTLRETVSSPTLSKDEKSEKYKDLGRTIGGLLSRL